MRSKNSLNDFNLNSYDLIAIDMDNTLVKYNLKNTLPLIHTLITKYLIERHDYCRDICEEFCPRLSQKGLVIDKRRGNVLKLDSNYRILSAKHGLKELTEEKIQSIYGSIYEELKRLPDLLSSGSIYTNPDFEFSVLKDFFTSPSAQVFAKCVDVMDKQNTSSDINYFKLWTDIYEVLCHMFNKEGFKSRTGGWFPALIENTDKYLIKSSEKVNEMLKKLRKSGKIVVLITASNIDYVRLLMNYCFGNHWNRLFNYVITFARKPNFFIKSRKFLSIDSNDEIQSSVSYEELNCGGIYAEGNWTDLRSTSAKQLFKSDPKCIYIGDSFNDDCIVPNKYVDCDTVAVVEELEAEERPELDSSYWKSFFGDSEDKPSLWFDLIEKHSKLIVSKIDCLVNYCY